MGSGICLGGYEDEVTGQKYFDSFCSLMSWMGVPKEKIEAQTGGEIMGLLFENFLVVSKRFAYQKFYNTF